MNYNSFRTAIANTIDSNGVKAITGKILQDAILSVVDALDLGALYLGEATTTTRPSSEANGFYMALQTGTYTHFQISVAKGEVALIVKTDSRWKKQVLTVMPYIDPVSKHWIVNGEDSGVLAEGQQGQPGTPAESPFKGWFNTDNIPTTGQEGDYCYVDDGGTTKVWRWNPNAEPPAFEETADTPDTDHTQTFASNESVNQVAIDGSKLVNPVNTADPNKPVLAKAEDVMQLKAKLEGVTASEEKQSYTVSLEQQNHRVLGSNGLIETSTLANWCEISVVGYKSIRFLGIAFRSTISPAYSDFGYACGHYENGNWVTDFCRQYELNSDDVAVTKEYTIENIPSGSTHFRTNCKYGSTLLTSSNFYLYLSKGDTVIGAIKKEAKYKSGERLSEITLSQQVSNCSNVDVVSGLQTMLLNSKLGEIKLEETKVVPVDDWHPLDKSSGYYGIEVSTGKIVWYNNTGFTSTRIKLQQDTEYVRFLGYSKKYTGVFPCWVFLDDYDTIVDYHEYYDDNLSDGLCEYLLHVPTNAKYLVTLNYAFGSLDTMHWFVKSDFYCYQRQGTSLSQKIDDKEIKLLNVALSEYNVVNGFYLSLSGRVTSSQESRCLIKFVRRGERYVIKANPTENWNTVYNIVSVGLSKNNNLSNGTYLDGAVAGIIKDTNSAERSYPAQLRLQWIAPQNGYMCLYYKEGASNVEVYLEKQVELETSPYDTYIEEDIAIKKSPVYTGGFYYCSKTYGYNPSKPYKVIFRTTSNQDFNSVEFLDINLNVLGSNNDANIVLNNDGVVYEEHVMEDLNNVPNGTAFIRLNYFGKTEYVAGTVDIGMAALMKPLIDDNTMSRNKMVYFVSKVRNIPFPNELNTEPNSTIIDNNIEYQYIWSAWGVKFPDKHSLKGKPIPLCAFFHGTGGRVTSEVLSYSIPYGTKMHNLLNDAGIAVFDINGRGVSFDNDAADGTGTVRGERQRHWGCPSAVELAKKAYQILIERFNCRKGMVVGGASMGGNILESYINTYPEDAVACFGCAPTNLGALVRSNTFKNGIDTAIPWNSREGDITNVIGYSKLIHPNIIDDSDFIKIWNSMEYLEMYPSPNGSTDDLPIPQTFVASWPVETIIWHGTMDTNVNICQSRLWVEAARKAGCNMKLRVCPDAPHSLVAYYDEIANFVKSKLLI